jgi:hypothetical protein
VIPLARAEANGYKRGEHKEKHMVPSRHKHVDKTKKDQDAEWNRYVLWKATSFALSKASLLLTKSARWNVSEMERDSAQRGLPPPNEATVRERFLGKGADAPDLATVKDCLRFRAATNRGKIVEKPTADSLNAFAEWFFAGFSRVTGTPTDGDERSEV